MNKPSIGFIIEAVFQIIAAIAILCSSIMFLSYLNNDKSSDNLNNEPSKAIDSLQITTVPDDEIIYTSAIDMLNEYDSNEIAADLKFDGKIVVVTGVVYEVGKTADFITEGTPYILFSSSGTSLAFGTVQANFKNKNEIKKLAYIEKGQQISVKGVCNGESTFNIMLSDCYIIE